MSAYQSFKAVIRSQATTPLSPERLRQLETLTRVNIDDLLHGVGLGHLRRGRRLVEWLVSRRAQYFADKIIAYDDLVGMQGLAAGGAWAVEQFVDRFEVRGQQHLPRTGSVLIIANHPGLCDTTALFAAIDRPDLRVVAASRPFLHALPNTSRHLLYIDATSASRLRAIRSVARHLRDGGTVLTFPGGQIEPDPAVLPGAVESLHGWSASIEMFARFAQDTLIVPAIVSGVLSPAALRHPLTYLRRAPADRQWLAALLQIQLRALQHVTVRVDIGCPISVSDADRGGVPVSDAVKSEARRLIEQVRRT
jgi:hypothetical protein